MAIFVLVHGSHGGGWVWRRLAPLLRAAGHEVYAPTLTGLADRAHLLGCGVDLTTHISDVASLLFYEDLSDVILVGNSYAGMVITGVAAKAPERLKLLIYLDAYIPADGQSESDLWPPERRALTAVAEVAPPGLFGVTDPALAAWITARSTPQPVATYTEPAPPGNTTSVEPLFAEAKQWHGLGRFKLRGLANVNSEALLVATGQNLKRWLQSTSWGRRGLPGMASATPMTPYPGE